MHHTEHEQHLLDLVFKNGDQIDKQHAYIYAEHEDKFLVKVKGHSRQSGRNRAWKSPHMKLIKKEGFLVLWSHVGAFGVQEVKELQELHNFNTNVN